MSKCVLSTRTKSPLYDRNLLYAQLQTAVGWVFDSSCFVSEVLFSILMRSTVVSFVISSTPPTPSPLAKTFYLLDSDP